MTLHEHDLSFKLLLLGDSGVGKSAIVRQYVDQSFSPSYISTIGVDYGAKYLNLPPHKVKLSIWDTAGQERFRSITRSYVRGVDCAVLVFDLTHYDSFSNVSFWIDLLQQYSDTTPNFCLIGNKADLAKFRQVPKEEAHRIAKQYKCEYFETTATDLSSVSLAFESIAKALVRQLSTPKININLIKKEQKNCCY
jgi:Ras-related protein Rab-1A